MRFLDISLMVLTAAGSYAAEDEVSASGRLEGKKVQFPAKGVAEGAKATIALLESCHDASDDTLPYTNADLEAARKEDHIRLVFAKPVEVTVLGNKHKVSEIVFTQPLNKGVFWLRTGANVVRCSKYEFQKQKAFEKWRDQAQPVE